MMATLFFGVTGPTLDLRQDLQIADTDAPRIIGYLMTSQHGKVTENIVSKNPDPNWTPGEKETEADRPLLETQAWVTRQASVEETAANYARAILSQLLSETVQFEKARAAAAAADAVSAIEPIDKAK
jgi:hypothetical protein